jgi:hypothetical protein
MGRPSKTGRAVMGNKNIFVRCLTYTTVQWEVRALFVDPRARSVVNNI